MYLAMSRLKVVSGKEVEFEEAWRKREQSIDGVKGFKEFNLIKGAINKEFTLYIFQSKWNSETDFINWTKSNTFQIAHKNPNSQCNLYLGPPDFDGYIGLPDFEGFKLVI
jgi:heme-degrading monooxygenase HmoA|tara:strand:- start:213 stop:542 length:330 start_codon:yes stop_codon:yes gene_type:complete